MSKGPDVIFLKEGMTIPSYKDTKAIKEIQSQENYVDFGTVPTLKEKPMTILLKNFFALHPLNLKKRVCK